MARSGLLLVLSQHAVLELCRRQVAERRAQALGVVNLFQKRADAPAGLGQVAIFGAVNLFVFQRLDERLSHRVGESCQLHHIATLPRRALRLSTLTIHS